MEATTGGEVRQELAQHVRLEGVTQVAVETPIGSRHFGNINIRLLNVSQNCLWLLVLIACHESCWLLCQQFPMPLFQLGPSNYLTPQANQDTPKNLYNNMSFQSFIFQFICILLATCDWNKWSESSGGSKCVSVHQLISINSVPVLKSKLENIITW